MRYDFDVVIPRKNTDSLKYDTAPERGKPDDTLPLWVADMDFQAPPPVLEKLMDITRHGIFGYTDPGPGYYEAVRRWFGDRFDFHPEPDWVVPVPGVVSALAQAVRALTEPGEAVLIQEPVYRPFSQVVLANGRRLINNSLLYENGRYHLDLDDFEEKIIDHRVRLFILCSPHNPVGRVWTRAELEALGRICRRHRCLVVSDEIHCDFVRPGHRHLVWASLSPELAGSSIICTAPSKTFNLAGLQAANLFIPNSGLREKIKKELARNGYGLPNTMGLAAGRAAYEHGREWLEQLLEYLEGNLAFLKERLAGYTGVRVVEPEATYLVWLDFNHLGLSTPALDDLVSRQARLWLDEGAKFGRGGQGFYRLNLACPRSVLAEALSRLTATLDSLG